MENKQEVREDIVYKLHLIFLNFSNLDDLIYYKYLMRSHSVEDLLEVKKGLDEVCEKINFLEEKILKK